MPVNGTGAVPHAPAMHVGRTHAFPVAGQSDAVVQPPPLLELLDVLLLVELLALDVLDALPPVPASQPSHVPKPDPSLLQTCAPIFPPAGWPGHAHATCAPGPHAGALPPVPELLAAVPPHAVGNMPAPSPRPIKRATWGTGSR